MAVTIVFREITAWSREQYVQAYTIDKHRGKIKEEQRGPAFSGIFPGLQQILKHKRGQVTVEIGFSML